MTLSATKRPLCYVVSHHDCQCHTPVPVTLTTPRDVGFYLWGRDVPAHRVTSGGCVYQFDCGDTGFIAAVLRGFPPNVVAGYLPLTLTANAAIVCTIRGTDQEVHSP